MMLSLNLAILEYLFFTIEDRRKPRSPVMVIVTPLPNTSKFQWGYPVAKTISRDLREFPSIGYCPHVRGYIILDRKIIRNIAKIRDLKESSNLRKNNCQITIHSK